MVIFIYVGVDFKKKKEKNPSKIVLFGYCDHFLTTHWTPDIDVLIYFSHKTHKTPVTMTESNLRFNFLNVWLHCIEDGLKRFKMICFHILNDKNKRISGLNTDLLLQLLVQHYDPHDTVVCKLVYM